MDFTHQELEQKELRHYVWHRNQGNLVIIVIDDECFHARRDYEQLFDPQLAIFSLLREQILGWPDTRAIGFFQLVKTETEANKVLEVIHQWLNQIATSNTQVYFLVDVLYGEGVAESARYTIKELTNSYSQNHIAYLTKAGTPQKLVLPGYTAFQKAEQTTYLGRHGVLRPDLMSFFGKGQHTDGITNDAIQLYARAWEAGWRVEGWGHDCLQDPYADQFKALENWLGIPRKTLYYSPDEAESAKSLMIWKGEDLWEKPPWLARDRRQIQGTVLNAVLKKLEIPLSETNGIPDDEFITMPCVPSFPFLVSLRSFLWRCQQEDAQVKEMRFFKLGQNPQLNVFRIRLQLNDFYRFARSFWGLERRGAFTSLLRDLTHCKTHQLTGISTRTIVKDYMRLFRDGTDLPVVAVEIVPQDQINLIWSVEK